MSMARARKRRGTTISVDVDIDVDEVLSDLSDEEILDEMRARKIEGGMVTTADLERVYDFLMRGEPEAALCLLDAAIHPNRTIDIKSAYEAAQKGKHPFLTVRSEEAGG
jgi:hypothetical protein